MITELWNYGTIKLSLIDYHFRESMLNIFNNFYSDTKNYKNLTLESKKLD